MKDRLRDLITFSARERKGTIVLIMVVIMIGGINLLVVVRHPPVTEEEYPGWMKDSGAVLMTGDTDSLNNESIQEPLQKFTFREIDPFFFDPNVASFEELLRLGLNARVCRTIVIYRTKGGIFRTPDDLKKIFGLSPTQYEHLSKYIRITRTQSFAGRKSVVIQKAEVQAIDINHADSALLEKLPGIGPVLANRILKYRSLLGGYYSSRQIMEVYGISDSLYMQIMDKLWADTTALIKINLNTASERELARHPYLGRYTASGIIRYRAQVIRIRNINELKINGLISEETFDKIKNYLSI